MSKGKEHSTELSIVIPTYNEAPNIPVLLLRLKSALEKALPDKSYEIIFVDDSSTDGTVKAIRETASREGIEGKVRIITRKNERDLSTAVLEGVKAARGTYIIVMDADLQHPPENVPEIYKALSQGYQLVVGSRKRHGRGCGLGLYMRAVSALAEIIARIMLPEARRVSDPMSGFFGFKRGIIEGKLDAMKPKGYKVLLEILVKGDYNPGLIREVPYVFARRYAGKSKLGILEVLRFLQHILRLNEYRIFKFALVGMSGVLVNEAMLWLTNYILALPLYISGLLAIETSILNNFTLNSIFTFKGLRVEGSLIKRTFKYHFAVALGLAVNYTVLLTLSYLFGVEALISNLTGIILGFLANYTLSEHYVWRRIKGVEPL